MIKLYSPNNESELAFIRTVLDSDGIPYFVHNDHFGSLRIGPPIELFNKKTIMVDEVNEERARELLSHFLSDNKEPLKVKQSYSFLDKVRMVIEFLLFGWFIPGRRCKERNNSDL